jgi:hypothetical protein
LSCSRRNKDGREEEERGKIDGERRNAKLNEAREGERKKGKVLI